METNQTPDFGEPWREQTVSFMPGTIEDRDGKVVNTREQKLRAIDCVAACAGIADPAKEIQHLALALELANEEAATRIKKLEDQDAEIQTMREAIKAASDAIALQIFVRGTRDDTLDVLSRLQAALTKLQPHFPSK